MNGGEEEDVSDEKFRIVHGYGNSEGNNGGDGVPEPETRNIVRILMDRSSGRFGCYGASGVPKNSNGGNGGLLNIDKCVTRDAPLSSSPNSTIDSTFHRNTGKVDGVDGDTEGVGSTRENVYDDNACARFSMSDLTSEIRRFGEAYSVTRFNADYLDMQNNTVSTISVAFSPDGKTLASTHGDHTVKITCCHSGRLIHSMEGHPRTPWTVKFHPTDSSRCASGCIGYQVRFWDTENGVCLKMVRLFNAIISLSFHPRGRLLSIACGNAMYLWDYMNRDSPHAEWAHEHTLRCVCFLPSGNKIIVGGLIRRQNSGGHPNDNRDTFGLKLWDFDFDAACSMIEGPGSLDVTEGEAIAQRVMTNSRRFLNHALLYNDGGFDVSPCGKHLIACSELLIPHGDACIISMVRAMERERRIERERDQSNLQLDCSPPQDEEHQSSRQMSRFDALSLNSPLQVRANNHQQTQRRVHTRDESMNATNDNVVQNGDEAGSEVRESDTNEGYTPRSPPAHAVDRSLPNSPPPPPGRRRNDTEEFVLQEISRSRTNVSFSSRLGSSGRALSPPPPPQRRRTQYSSDVLNKHNPTRRLPNTQDANTEIQAYTTEADEHDRPTLTPDRRRILRELALRLASGKPVPMDTAQNMTLFMKECRRIPHVVLISLDDEMDKLGQLLDACPLEESRASGVTCVKFSPSTQYCLLGYGVRENEDSASDRPPHQVTSLFRVRGGMKHMVSLLSLHDDVNIARFHPESGHGFVYGTKQGRVRILSPKPWTSQISPKD